MLLDDPKTFDAYMKRSVWGPWVAVALVFAVMVLLFVVAVVFERDPTDRFAPIGETGKWTFAIATGLVIVVALCIAPFWSRNMRVLTQRGRRTQGRVASYAPLPKGGARLVTIEFQAGGELVQVNRDVPKDDVDELLRTVVTLVYDPQKPSRVILLPPDIARLPLA
ncbi:MAG: hypothetical protein ACFCVE_16110 [Phycisphaerae bacterium]